MSKTARRALGFDSLEGKVLLSTGMADPARAVHVAKVQRFLLNGALFGLPYGTIQQTGFAVSSFSVVGKAQSMGKVSGSFSLANPFIAQGKLPDLSGAKLTLSNQRGSVQLTMASSPSHRYIFVVTSGTGSYTSLYGSGTAVISFNRKMIDFEVRLHSAIH
jgi:hypothetical protein